MEELLILRAFAKPKLFLTLILISYSSLGHDCSVSKVVEGLHNASILQGSNHTFWCKGIGSSLFWEINGMPVYKLPEDSMLEAIPAEIPDDEGCTSSSSLGLSSRSVPGDNTSTTFTISCVVQASNHEAATSDAYLKVHVIGKAGEVSLNAPGSSEEPAMIKWKAPDVLSGSTLPVYYNITVQDSLLQTIAQATTTDTNYTISSNELSPCKQYHLTVLPFQQISGYTELGIMAQTDSNYSGTPLPAIDVNLGVSVQPDSAQVTIYFQVQQTDCNLQTPEKLTVTLIQYGPNGEKVVLSFEQAAIGEAHEYTLKKSLDLRQNYWTLIKLENNFSSSAPEIADFSTFNVQSLTLTLQEEKHELSVHCGMAKGAEDKHCIVKMRNQTMSVQCPSTSGTDATCELSGLAPGQYMALAYDEEYVESPAVEYDFVIPEEWNEDSANTTSSTKTDYTTSIATTILSSSTNTGGTSAIIITSVISTAVLVGLLIVSLIVIVLVLYQAYKRKIQSEVSHENHTVGTITYTYEVAEENEREATPPPPIAVRDPPSIHRNPAYESVAPRNIPACEIVGCKNPAYVQVTLRVNSSTGLSAAPDYEQVFV